MLTVALPELCQWMCKFFNNATVTIKKRHLVITSAAILPYICIHYIFPFVFIVF